MYATGMHYQAFENGKVAGQATQMAKLINIEMRQGKASEGTLEDEFKSKASVLRNAEARIE